MRTTQEWYKYQQQAAEVFKSLGCEAAIEEKTIGVRGEHKIDVLVTFKKFGYSTTWIVECKFWKTKVTKEKIVTLHGIVQDVGADKGILLSEKGFQIGAEKYSIKTNMILTSLAELKSKAQSDLFQHVINDIFYKITRVQKYLHNTTISTSFQKKGATFTTSNTPPGFFKIFGELSILESAAKQAILNEFPVFCGIKKNEKPIIAKNIFELQKLALKKIDDAMSFYEKNKYFKKKRNTNVSKV